MPTYSKLWVFPMAGRGIRTQSAGEFKPFIEINGLKMVQWFLRSIKENFQPIDTLYFITRECYYKDFAFTDEIGRILKNEGVSCGWRAEYAQDCDMGQALTVYHAKREMKAADIVIVSNCDQFISFPIPMLDKGEYGFMTVTADLSNSKSYVRIANGHITEVKEKENISLIASTGVYCVCDGSSLVWALEKMISDKLTVNGEYYVSPSLNYLITERHFRIQPVITSFRFDLGTVNGIERFKKFIFDTKESGVDAE